MKPKYSIKKKVEEIRWKKLFQQNSTVIGMNSYEIKLRKLRNNNKSLAKALSEQKMEANHWFTEAVSLKGELQEAHEKLLRLPYSNANLEDAFFEAEKQIKECYKSIDKDFNLALERIVDAVNKIAKAKQLVTSTLTILQLPSQSSGKTFSRMSGSRTPLGANTGGPLRQRAVLPMVSGHVLQPAMVPLPKLKIRLNDARLNSIHVHEENAPDISTIGEESPDENDDVSDEQLRVIQEEDQPWSNAESTLEDGVPGTRSQSEVDSADLGVRFNTLSSKTRCSPESPEKLQVTTSCRRRGVSKRGTGRGRGRRKDSTTSKLSPAKVSEPLADEVLQSTPDEDDPLEGPSWLLNKEGFQRTFRGHYRGHRKRMKSQRGGKKTAAAASIDSPDEVVETRIDVSKVIRQVTVQECSPRREATSATTSPTHDQSHDQSCIDTPTSMFARLELLEAKGGRKSKRFLSRKLGTAKSASELQVDIHDTRLEESEPIEGSPKKMPCTPSLSSTKDPGVISFTKNREQLKTTTTVLNESTEAEKAANDQTCQIITNMDITQPVSDVIIQQNYTSEVEDTEGLQEGYKSTQSKRRFFKTKEQELIEEVPKVVGRTPFDLSMLNETAVSIPPFSSTRTTEKENLQPMSYGDGDEPISLCDVSVVLKDVIKEHGDSETPRRSLKVKQKGSQSPKGTLLNSSRRSRRVSRKLKYSVNITEDDDDNDVRDPTWGRQAIKRKEKKQSPAVEGASVNSSSSLEHKRLKKSAAKLILHNNLEDAQRKAEEVEVTDARVLSHRTENTETLHNCYVKIQRTNIKETPSPRADQDNSLGSDNELPDLHQLHSEEEKGKATEMRATADAVNTERDTILLQTTKNRISAAYKKKVESPARARECKKRAQKPTYITPSSPPSPPPPSGTSHTDADVELEMENNEEGIEEHEEPEIILCSDDHIQQHAREPQDAGGEEAMEKRDTPSPEVIVWELDEISPRNSFGAKKTSGNAEQPFLENHLKRRRATTKVTSYKEIRLNRKMRRGENGTVFMSPSGSTDKNGKRGRGRPKKTVTEVTDETP